jgi:uncharacterized membrane protein
MDEVSKNIFGQIAAIVGGVAGVFLALVKTRDAFINFFNLKPFLRKSIKADLELLKLMEKTDPGYNELKNHIKNQIDEMIKKKEKTGIVSGNWGQILVGLLMAGGFGYWTYHISRNPDISNWWTILTVWMSFAGIGFLTSAFQKRSPGKANKTNTPLPND